MKRRVVPKPDKLIRAGGRPQTLIIVLLAVHIGLFVLYAFASGPKWIQSHVALSAGQAIGHLELWQPLSAFWLHINARPLVVNMLVLWIFGTAMLRWWGAKRFMVFYIVAGVVGLCAAMLVGLAWPLQVVAGSTGAMMGMLIAFTVIFPEHHVFFYGLLPLKAKWLCILLAAFVVIGTLVTLDFMQLALQGGGALAGLLFVYNPRRLIGLWRVRRAKKQFKIIEGGKSNRDEPRYLN